MDWSHSPKVICHLTEADLTEIGIEKVGAKRRFLTAIAHEGRVQGVKRSFELSNSGTPLPPLPTMLPSVQKSGRKGADSSLLLPTSR